MSKATDLDSNVSGPERRKLTGVIGEDDDPEVLGFSVWSMTGDVLVPRDWLHEQFTAEGIPMTLFPREVSPVRAYNRTMNRLVDADNDEDYVRGHTVTYELKEGDGTKVHKLYADVFYPEDEIGVEEGEWRSQTLGYFDYDYDRQDLTFTAQVDEDSVLHDEWLGFVGRAQGLMKKMETHHTGQDMRDVLKDLRQTKSSAIPIRHGGIVYFFHNGYADLLEGLAHIWARMDKYKDEGFPTRLTTMPVVDDERRRELVEQHAREMVEDQVNEAIETGIEKLTDDDTTPDEIAREIKEEISQSTDLADEYSQLLEVELSVKRHIDRWLRGVKGDKEELIEEVLDQTDLDD